MHELIKDIIPESLRDTLCEQVLCNNVTYTFKFPKEFYHEVYEFEEYINTYKSLFNYRSRLREKNDGKGMAIPCSIEAKCTNYPLGVVVNVDRGCNEQEFEKIITFYMLSTDSNMSITKVDNVEYLRKKQQEKEDIFNSLFEVE